MNLAHLTHGPAKDAADALHSAHVVEKSDLTAALVNALYRIHALEVRLEKAESTARRAANVASCLVNGIQPDQ